MNESLTSVEFQTQTASERSSARPGRSDALAQPLTLPCGVVLRNRLVKSAMSEGLADQATNRPTPELMRLYERWGRSGAAMLITGHVMVDRRSLGEPGNVAIEDDHDLGPLREWAAAAKAGGAAVIVQLNHPGRQTPPLLSSRVVAPSAVRVKAPGARFPKPRALTGPEVEELVQRYATAAGIAVRAGFDGVQLHGAHGYLISQFLSPLVNKRDDEWGGDPERRRRFLIEIVRAVRAAIGPSHVLSVKLNSADFQRGGFDEDESLRVVAALEAEGIDLLEVSGGTFERPAMVQRKAQPQKESTRAREAYFLEFAERARAEVGLPLMITGGLRSGTGMREALQAGVDVVGLARPLCLEPDLPAALLADQAAVSRLQPITTGLPALDGAAELFWGSIQLRRMGAGREPSPRLGGRQALIRAVVRDGLDTLRRRRVS
jgi:2,4-dienoyl-CoA reductase-like NADH-dependent reductase (Old Yellow Enzyme family)